MPSTLHEAFRASLFEKYGRTDNVSAFRPTDAPRKGSWLGRAKSVASHGSKDYQSLQIAGPLPWLVPDDRDPRAPCGLFFPLPMDLGFAPDGKASVLHLRQEDSVNHSSSLPALAVSLVPASKQLKSGFLSADAMTAYLNGQLELVTEGSILPWDQLFAEEYRIGVELAPRTNSAVRGQLYAATHARPSERFRIAAWAGLKQPVGDEAEKLDGLEYLLFGGERRMARIEGGGAEPVVPALPAIPDTPGPVMLRWTLATSAVFVHGWLPGWCRDSSSASRPDGEVCLQLDRGRAHLIAACIARPLAFAGWDVVEGTSKPTRLAVHAGSVYYFLCENAECARELAALLHWRPRSDLYGEKGFGYGLASAQPTSPDIRELAARLF